MVDDMVIIFRTHQHIAETTHYINMHHQYLINILLSIYWCSVLEAL